MTKTDKQLPGKEQDHMLTAYFTFGWGHAHSIYFPRGMKELPGYEAEAGR